MPEKTGRKQAATRFKPGRSGNPAGRPKGARNRASVLAQVLMEEQTEAVVQTVIDAAIAGDMTACRLIVERLVPPVKERPIDADLKLPASISSANAGAVFREIFKAVSGGRLVPGEGKTLVDLMNSYLTAHEYSELAERISELEEAAPRGRKW